MIHGGSGTVNSFWYQDSWNSKRCKLVEYETAWSVYVLDDYKRCVCYSFGASTDGSAECPQEETSQEQCNWNVSEPTTEQTITIPVASEINIDIYDLIQNLEISPNFPACIIDNSNSIIELAQYMVLELVNDNQGLSYLNTEFRDNYTNGNDSVLGADAP